jgi:hypothetical protein
MFFKKRAAVKQFNLMIAGNRFVVASSWADSGDVLRKSPELLTSGGLLDELTAASAQPRLAG